MRLRKTIRLSFLLSICKCVSIFLLLLVPHCNCATFNECFPEKYNFICGNPNDFLHQTGITLENNIIDRARLQLLDRKFNGGSSGGIYQGNHNTYFIKQSNVFTEFIGSKLMSLIMGKKCTPVVKLVRDQIDCIASTKLEKFKTRKELESKKRFKRQKLVGEADITVAMDFLGIVDRHSKNMGYIKLRSKKLLAARVDFDASFAFEIRPRANAHYQETSNHMNLNLLYLSMQTYPEHEVRKAIKNITDIPDEKIVTTIFECWATFSQMGYAISSESCFNLARKLIERKSAFNAILNDPNAVNYLSLQEDPVFNKVFKELKKSKQKSRKRRRYN